MTERIQEFLRNRRTEGLHRAVPVVDSKSCVTTTRPSPRPCRTARVLRGKANPSPEVLQLLASMGSCFDTATVAEIEMALAPVRPRPRPYGNTIKKERDIARAFALGIRLFAVDCAGESRRSPVPPPAQGVLPHPL